MTKIKLTFIVLLIFLLLQGLPAGASNSGTTSITGTIPLMIYNMQTSGVTCCAAKISWQTNGKSTSQVFYDTQSHESIDDYAYHSSLNSALVMQHNIPLSGLTQCTTYHYRVKSAAIIGGIEFTAVSPDYIFQTSCVHVAPIVTTCGTLCPGPTSAVLWGTLLNRGTASPVEVYFQWGKTKSYGFETNRLTLTGAPRTFVIPVGGLARNTTYHFRAVAVGDGISYGKDQVFRTCR